MRILTLLIVLSVFGLEARAQFDDRLQTLEGTLLAPADIDGDGIVDFLSLTIGGPDNTRPCCFSLPDTLKWYRHLGGFGTNPPATLFSIERGGRNDPPIFALDVDGDGDTDLVSNTRLPRLYSQDPTGNYIQVAEYPNCGDGIGGLADLNVDGRLDLICHGFFGLEIGYTDPQLDISSLARFGPQGTSVRLLATADFTGDGFVDLLINGPSAITVGVGSSSGPASSIEITSLPASFVRAIATDLDGDGDIDILGLESSRQLVWALNAGDGLTWTHEAVFTFPTASSRYPLEFADIDGDGFRDVLHTSSVAHGLPNGAFEDRGTGVPLGAVALDLDGDGDLDLVGTQVARNSTVGSVNSSPQAVRDNVETDEDTTSRFAVLANDSDPDGDQLRVTISFGPRVLGSSDTSTVGEAVAGADGSITVTPPEDFSGRLWLRYRATDPWGRYDQESVFIDVIPVNDPPRAVNDTTYAKLGFPATINVVANDTDPEGDLLSVLRIESGPANGSVELLGGSELRFSTQDPSFAGDSFVYEVADPDGLTDTGTVVVLTAADFPPIANGDELTVVEDGSASLNPTDNDLDLDSPALSLESVSSPTHGTLSVSGNQVTYTPDPNFSGTDSFGYTVTDGTTSVPGSVTVQVSPVNDPPELVGLSVRTRPDVSLRINFEATDVDGDRLTTSVIADPANGSLNLIPFSTIVDYTPNLGFQGTDSFSLTTADPDGETSEATFALTVVEVVRTTPLFGLDGSLRVAFADIDSDGIDDVVGSGGWVRLVTSTPEYTQDLAIASQPWTSFDINRDGRDDLCFYGSNNARGLHTLRHGRGRTFGPELRAPGCHITADISDDGRPELAFTVEERNQGAGELGVALSSLGEIVVLSEGDYREVITADMNDDGRLDIVASTTTSAEIWLADTDHFGLVASFEGVTRVRPARLNGDTQMDLVGVAIDNSSFLSWINQGGEVFQPGPAAASGSSVQSPGSDAILYAGTTAFIAADIDGDGLDDILTDESNWIQKTDAGWALPFQIADIQGRKILDAGDFNGDGVIDFAILEPSFRNGTADRIYAFENLIGTPPSGDPDAETVSADLLITAGNLSQSLRFGLRRGASTSFDVGSDQPAPPPPPAPVLDARFKSVGLDLFTDIRDREAAAHTWRLSVSSSVGTPQVSWNPAALPDGLSLQIIDAAGGDLLAVDMSENSSTALLDGVSEYHIRLSVVSRQQSVASGWNLIGLPFDQLQEPVDVLFPRAIANTLFRFRRVYEAPTDGRFEPGRGYWLRYTSDQIEAISGRPLTEVSVDLDQGWNLVSPPDCTVPLASVLDPAGVIIDGTLFGYAGAYRAASEMSSGSGYWIRATADGTITMRCVATKRAVVADPLAGLDRAVVDGFPLYLGFAGADDLSFTTPPIGPSTRWQASFDNGRYVTGQRGRMNLSSAPSNVTVWGDGATLSLIDARGKELTTARLEDDAPHRLDLSGALWMELWLDEETPPEQFLLSRPYPNPFHGSTTLELSLPEPQYITVGLYDVTGRLVQTIADGIRSEGVHELVVSSSRLTNGLYFVKASGPGASSVQSILLVH